MNASGSVDGFEEWITVHGADTFCPTCRAQPGTPCVVRNGKGPWHAPRIDKALKTYQRQRYELDR